MLIGLYLRHTDHATSRGHRSVRTATHLYADSLKPENFPALPSRLGGGRLTAGGGLCALTLDAAAMHSRAAQMQTDVKGAIAALCNYCCSGPQKVGAPMDGLHMQLAYAPKKGFTSNLRPTCDMMRVGFCLHQQPYKARSLIKLAHGADRPNLRDTIKWERCSNDSSAEVACCGPCASSCRINHELARAGAIHCDNSR